jgi:hypothetical protein
MHCDGFTFIRGQCYLKADVHRPSVAKAIVSGYLPPDYCQTNTTAAPTHPSNHPSSGVTEERSGDGSERGSEREGGSSSSSSRSIHDGLCVNPEFEAGMLEFGDKEVEQLEVVRLLNSSTAPPPVAGERSVVVFMSTSLEVRTHH